ncbi:MAG TPA: DUF499 domain-containing protein, partial [Miltoncostaeaceae bacterium]|nr:DUF499 domain-containing protein [Miltoncostaeaceae bacterium]
LETVNAPGAAGLLPWREVLEPHEDVATGNFQAAEFAADLYKVATSEDAGRDYSDPVLFFSRTYLTAGLRDLIDRAVRRLSGDANASPVINLQTNFGGGKTHSMLALWHLASGLPASAYPQELQELLAGRDVAAGGAIRRVALVGNHLSVQGDIKPDGTRVNTLWGELAWQLGGAEAFAQVAEADAAGTPPGQVLHRLLADHAPAVILIDEWVAYARTLVGRDDLPAGTFDDQFTFAQALTEAVKGTPGVLLAISIPASESGDDATRGAGSDEEVGGSNGQKALERLQNVVRRVADQWRPASAEEAYRIVRQRLFTTPSPAALAHIGQTARSFVELYHKHQGEFPREARSGSYEDRIINSYPIHPELFDRLYEDWSGLERFQRTRGVLRLMNSVIHALWVGQDSAPLIMPSSIPLRDEGVNAELTQYLQDSWKAVIDADVDGPNAEPLLIDREKPLFGKRSLTRRLARTVFFGGAPTIGSAHKGLETQRVFLGTAVPGDVPGNFHSALAQLSDRATYFYNAGGRYWYDLQANISRQARDRAERMHIEDVYRDIIDRLRHQGAERGAFAGVVICPDDAAEIPDLDECRLVILHPRYAHTRNDPDSPAMMFARQATDHRGTANRTHRNMLIYLAPDAARFEDLEQAVRTHLAWSSILEDEAALDLTSNQRQQADEKRQQATATADERLLGAYHWTLVPIGQPIELDVIKTEGNQPALAQRVSRQLGNKGLLAEQHPANLIRLQLDTKVQNLWQDGHVRVGDLWRIYSEYPYMPRLRDRRVFDDGLSGPQQILWQQEGFALADGYDETTARYRGLTLPDDRRPIVLTDGTLIVRPERAVAQRAAEAAEAQAAAPMAASPGTGEPDAPGGAATITGVAPGGTGIPGALAAPP